MSAKAGEWLSRLLTFVAIIASLASWVYKGSPNDTRNWVTVLLMKPD
jgi:hypothetical protein